MNRITWMDGLRGIACMQVVYEHCCGAFIPDIRAPLLHATLDFPAVMLFFLMSGFVLTRSFEKARAGILVSFAARVLRLGVPALAAVAIAIPMAVLGRPMLVAAAASLHSPWLASLVSFPPLYLLRAELSGFTLLAGYQDSSLFALLPGLDLRARSLDPPLWTLQIEIFGSLWILFLVTARRRSRVVFIGLLLSSVFFIGINELVMFTAGYVCARCAAHDYAVPARLERGVYVAGTLLVIAGLWLSCGPGLAPVTALARVLPHGDLTPFKGFSLQTEIGAMMMFTGLLLTPWLQRIFAMRIPRYLGHLSFPIYLLNWPILLSFGCSTFMALHGLGYVLAALLASGVSVGLTLAGSAVFERFVDAPAVAVGRYWQRRTAGPVVTAGLGVEEL